MKKIVEWLSSSVYIPPLSPGCKLCAEGGKLVLLVTGKCNAKCFYCPLSSKKKDKDKIFADEWELRDEDDIEKILIEAKLIEAKGAGITGGDPLVVIERTCRYISLLKNEFGENFHIHLYTPNVKDSNDIEKLARSGLDEIRFHPAPQFWSDMEKSGLSKKIKHFKNLDVDAAIEIPVLPDRRDDIISLIVWANENDIDWVNLNELEYSESNYENLDRIGYTLKNESAATVAGSEEVGVEIIKRCSEMDLNIGIHYCSSSFKDGIQLRNRIKRRAKNVARPYDVITEDGTLLRGAIYGEINLKKLRDFIVKTFDVPPELVEIDDEKKRVNVAAWFLQEIASELWERGFKCYMVEEYPTADRLEVERIDLPVK